MKAIMAVNEAGFIGLNGGLPWRCKADLKHFREKTMGATCVVGRVTYEGLCQMYERRKGTPPPKGQPLEGRLLIPVGSSSACVQLSEILRCPRPDWWVIGGKKLYEALLPHCTELHLSVIEGRQQGDTNLPQIDELFKGELYVYEFKPDRNKKRGKT